MLELIKTIKSIIPGLWAQRWWGLTAAALIGFVGIGVAILLPNKFAATTRVYVDTQSILKPLMSGLAVQPNLDQQVAMMARTLISRPNIENLVRMADLDHKVDSPNQRDALVDRLVSNIVLKPGQGNNVYLIEYRDTNPDDARKVVQSLLTIFVESNLGGKRRDSEQAQKFIEEQIGIYEKRLNDAEQALKEFKLRNLDVMPNLARDYITRANEAQNDLSRARLELRQAESARDALRRQLSGERPELGTESAVSPAATARPSELELRTEAARQKLAEMRIRLTDLHPDVVEAKQMLSSLEEELATQRRTGRRGVEAPAAQAPSQGYGGGPVPNKIYQDLKMAVADADAKVASLQAAATDAQQRYAEAKSMARVVPQVEAEYTQLNRDYDINKKNYEQLVARRDSAQISGSMDSTAGVGEIRVIDPPRVSPQPVWPNRPFILGIGFLASIVGGLAVIVLRDQSRPRFFDLRTLRNVTGLPVLGAISLAESPEIVRQRRSSALRFAGGLALLLLTFAVAFAFLAVGHSMA